MIEGFSNCCAAIPEGEIDEHGTGICSDCKEGAIFRWCDVCGGNMERDGNGFRCPECHANGTYALELRTPVDAGTLAGEVKRIGGMATAIVDGDFIRISRNV